MVGRWTGTYTGMNKNLTVPTDFDSIPFELYIESFEKEKFNGFIEDRIFHLTDKFGIQGTIKNDKINFQKYKTINQGSGNEFVTTEMDKDGPVILYKGQLNKERTEISGEWKFRVKIILLFGFIPIPFRRGKGTWNMKYVGVQ